MQHSVYYVFKNIWVVKETMSSKRSFSAFSEFASDVALQATRMGKAAMAAVGSAAQGAALSLGVVHVPTTSLLLQEPCDEAAVLAAVEEIFDVRNGNHKLTKHEFFSWFLTCARGGMCVQVTDEIQHDDNELSRIAKEHFRYLVNQGTNAGRQKARKFARLWHTDEAKVDAFIIHAQQQQEIYDTQQAKLAAETLVLENLEKERLALEVDFLRSVQQLLKVAQKQEICDAREAELENETLLLQAAEGQEELALPVRSDAAPDAPSDAAPDAACSHLAYLCEYGSDKDPF